MTRDEIKTTALAQARSYVQTDREVDPFLLDMWLGWVVGQLCQITDFAFLSFSTDINSGQAVYCLPDLYYLEAMEAVMADGRRRVLAIKRTQQVTSLVSEWRIAGATGDPDAAIIQGGGNLLLYPTPNYSALGGLTIRGTGVLTNAAWPNGADECPLWNWHHQTVCHGLTARILGWMKDRDGQADYERQFKYGKGHFESQMATYTEAHRHRTSSDFSYGGGEGFGGSGPLDL